MEQRGLSPEEILEGSRKLSLKNRLQIRLAELLFPDLSKKEAMMAYVSVDDDMDYSRALREILKERPDIYIEIEEDLDGTAGKLVAEVKRRARLYNEQNK